jgi:hypothetical protein
MQAEVFVDMGFRLWAMIRHTISRSVTTPIGFNEPGLQTGICPQSSTTIMAATSAKSISGEQHVGSFVMISWIFIMFSLLGIFMR